MVLNLIHVFLTYIKIHPLTGKIYVGRTSGWVPKITDDYIDEVLRKRDAYHQKNKEGFDAARLDQFSVESDAIRGQADIKIDAHKSEGNSANIYRGISLKNKKRKQYIMAAIRVFGDLIITYWLFL